MAGCRRSRPASRRRCWSKRNCATSPKGDYVFRAGDGPGGLHGIVAGSFGTYCGHAYSAPALSHILHPGWWCGEGPALGGLKRVLTVRAMEPGWTLHLPLEAARALVLSNPEAARSIGVLGQIALRVAIANVSQLMIRRSDRRIGAVLLRVTGALDEARCWRRPAISG